MKEDILMCVPVQEARSVYPGSIESECADCEANVWVSPSGQELVREKALTIVCLKCGLDRAVKASELPEIRITAEAAEAAEEVRAWLNRN